MPPAGDSPPRLISIIGPTGIGKTGLAIALARAFEGEIVGADSRQIYRHMDIGTAKPTPAEQAAAPHHLIDVVDPDQTLSMAVYQSMAYAAIQDIHGRGKVPFLVGGTGQYVTAVLEGWSAPEVAPDPALRAELEALSAAELYARLAPLDPVTAERIDRNNARRLVRALEVCILSGRPFSEQRQKHPPPFATLEIGLNMARESLYPRLDVRIDQMMTDGLLAEVEKLVSMGYGWGLPAMSGLGYAQLGMYLRGEVGLAEAVMLIKRATRDFVRRQDTWFRRHGSPMWLMGEPHIFYDRAAGLVAAFLKGEYGDGLLP